MSESKLDVCTKDHAATERLVCTNSGESGPSFYNEYGTTCSFLGLDTLLVKPNFDLEDEF